MPEPAPVTRTVSPSKSKVVLPMSRSDAPSSKPFSGTIDCSDHHSFKYEDGTTAPVT